MALFCCFAIVDKLYSAPTIWVDQPSGITIISLSPNVVKPEPIKIEKRQPQPIQYYEIDKSSGVMIIRATNKVVAVAKHKELPVNKTVEKVAQVAISMSQSSAQPDDENSAIRLILSPDKKVGFNKESSEQELLLRFDLPINVKGSDAILNSLSHKLETIERGYDTLLIRNRGRSKYSVVSEGGQIAIDILPLPVQLDEQLNVKQDPARLELVKGRWLLENGRIVEARNKVEQLLQKQPDYLDALLELANIEERVGRWQEAVSILDIIEKDYPQMVEIPKNRKRIIDAFGRHVGVEFHKITSDNGEDQEIYILSGRAVPGRNIDANWQLQRRRVDFNALNDPTTGQGTSYNGYRHKGELNLEKITAKGSRVGFNLFAQDARFGLGLDISTPWQKGAVSSSISLQKPYWELPTAVVYGGYGNHISLGVRQRLATDTVFAVKGSYNQYGLDDVSQAAESLALAATITHTDNFGPGELYTQYGFDGEYLQDQVTMVNSSAQEYNPFPLDSREVHTLMVGWAYPWQGSYDGELQAGYGYDRINNSSGPIIYGNLGMLLKDNVKLKLDFSLNSISNRGGDVLIKNLGVALVRPY
ncbi:MAG: tetratricopeptide repeat protein [Magnetococcales bacterium]|nr:tetratricopeptide repeat protein [Magnetococcales bacterium]